MAFGLVAAVAATELEASSREAIVSSVFVRVRECACEEMCLAAAGVRVFVSAKAAM